MDCSSDFNGSKDQQRKCVPQTMSRRRLIQAGAGLAGLTYLSGCGPGFDPKASKAHTRAFSSSQNNRSRKKLAIIGGGIGGVASAYFCDPSWQIDLFEARYKIGGHCDTRLIELEGESLALDLGAQFFHPDTHPLYIALLRELGLYQPDRAEQNQVIEAEGSLCIFKEPDQRPLFNSQSPLSSPIYSIDFARFTRSARHMIVDQGPWEIKLGDWIDSLGLSRSFKTNILVPWLSSLIGSTIEKAQVSSARSILQTFALAFPASLFGSATTMNSKIGLEGYLNYLILQCQNLKVHTNAAIEHLERNEEGLWTLTSHGSRFSGYDAVVVNATPRASQQFLQGLDWAKELRSLLNRFEYFRTRIVVHTDPIYVHNDRQSWGVHNARWSEHACEGSVWMGAIHKKLDHKLDIFKSWASHRLEEPSEILAERWFQHPLITPDAVAASRELARWQGHKGLWFAGHFMTGMDLQEAGVFIAKDLAQRIAPESSTLKAFERRLSFEGKQKISYHL